MRTYLKTIVFAFCLVPFLASCTSIPNGISPVGNFELDKYLGKWYEIARLDHKFERDLMSVTAEYSLLENGTVEVLNSGYSITKQKNVTAEGKARFVGDQSTGHLKVSFFGPFYGSYVVFELGNEYEYAFVAGPNKKYLWLLSRTPNPKQSVVDSFVSRAGELDFPIDELIMVNHPL